ncbi:MAG: SAM-dependent chlorinase/fluorinase [Gemmatimonadota bacterium]|nr:MAG: SAM-dependent chlorinase/fluorinase [Gemmatimonadota bacterium]
MPVITLLTDFGTRDGFVGAMKGVVLETAPGTQIIDITHDIPPGDVEFGAWVLSGYWKLFPPATVHIGVVDPGVGGPRKAIALEVDGRYLVVPDNGLATGVLATSESWRCVELTETRFMRSPRSTTFHGRDIFAPVAAHLAAGADFEKFGPLLKKPLRLTLRPPTRGEGKVHGRVAHIDRFGNLITDIPADWVEESWRFEYADRPLGRLKRTYADAGVGDLVVIVGSLGTVEIAVREGSAAKRLGAARGDPIIGKGPSVRA